MNPIDELITASEFREAMAQLPSAVSVVTSDGRAGRCGITASSVCSVTDDPPTVLVCINRSSRSTAIIKANGVVAINLLNSAQHRIAQSFSSRTDRSIEERFSDPAWQTGASGAPCLAQALMSIQGAVAQVHEVGTHSVFIVNVQHAVVDGRHSPTLYFRRAYAELVASEIGPA
ncbi:flavin reductase [Paucibacter sp. XJ19-41]|uniref:flavin reductase n=1 Tax=Paucibacter sp. XJ19-41 TaxID=2927824 RepID=UPI00234BE017|nr:flavin reductase [Paucibacter sp. XJ19-41]MDC6167159.1 flavin reductase [Paucibacter sp. XJ19-41]